MLAADQTDWALVRSAGGGRLPAAESLRAVWAAYVADLFARGPALSGRADGPVTAVLQDLAAWFARSGGRPAAVQRAIALVEDAGEAAADARLQALLARAVREGLPAPDIGGGRRRVERNSLHQFLNSRKAPPLWRLGPLGHAGGWDLPQELLRSQSFAQRRFGG